MRKKYIGKKIQAAYSSEAENRLVLQAKYGANGEPIAVTDRTFSLVAYTGGRMRPQYWGDDVVVDLAGIKIPDGPVPVLLDHCAWPEYVIGSTTVVTITGGTVKADGKVTAVGEEAVQAIDLADAGHPLQCSLGLDELAATYVDAGASVQVNGQTFNGPVVVVSQATLREISVTVIGADGKTSFAIDGKQPVITAGGTLPLESVPPIITLGSPVVSEPTKNPDAVQAQREALAQDAQRIQTINSLHASYGSKPGSDRKKIDEIQISAIKDGWDVQKTEFELLKASRNDTAPGRVLQANAIDARTIEAAMAIRAGVRPQSLEKEYGQEILNRASDQTVRASASFAGLANMVLAAAGQSGFTGSMTDASIKATFQAERMLQASGSGVSTISLSGILSNVANKALMQAFFAVDDGPLQAFGRDSSNNFKQVSRYRMTSVGDFEEVAKDGEIKEGTVSEETFTNQVKTFARKIGISRQDLINDDLGAFTQIGQHLGRKAKIRLHKLAFGVLLGNANNFFHANNKNLSTGAGSALSIAGLTAAAKLFMEQTDGAGDPVMVMPKFLLVAPANDVVSKQLYTDLTVNETTTANAGKPNSNPHRGAYTPFTSPFMKTGSGLTGALDAKYFLLADPADVTCISLIFLNGNETPIIESSDLDFNTLGVAFRGYYDIGAAQADYRGGVQSNGS